jgi:periplasmic protein TonB
MIRAILYQSRHKWRFGVALTGAAVIHLAAISLAGNRHHDPVPLPGLASEPPEITVEPSEPIPDPQADLSEPLPTPPPMELLFAEEKSTPPPVRTLTNKLTPIPRLRNNMPTGSLPVSSAKVFAVSAPRPEYPYEARRQRITGDGIAVMTVDPGSGIVTNVSISKTTGRPFLDNAAMAGFKRWRFKPGTISSVTCPVTFTLTGATY